MKYRERIDLLSKYVDYDAMSCEEYNETVPVLTKLCDEMDMLSMKLERKLNE